jgi:hypothetical protein
MSEATSGTSRARAFGPASSLRSCGLLAQAFASRVAKAVERTANVRGVEDHEDFGKYGFTVGAGWAYPQE